LHGYPQIKSWILELREAFGPHFWSANQTLEAELANGQETGLKNESKTKKRVGFLRIQSKCST
jgi:hypothetical protein